MNGISSNVTYTQRDCAQSKLEIQMIRSFKMYYKLVRLFDKLITDTTSTSTSTSGSHKVIVITLVQVQYYVDPVIPNPTKFNTKLTHNLIYQSRIVVNLKTLSRAILVT